MKELLYTIFGNHHTRNGSRILGYLIDDLPNIFLGILWMLWKIIPYVVITAVIAFVLYGIFKVVLTVV